MEMPSLTELTANLALRIERISPSATMERRNGWIRDWYQWVEEAGL